MTKQTSTNKLLKWLDTHLLELIAGFLLAFLPLYPKWPLLDALPGYIVRIRLEDFVVLFSFLIYLIQAKRGKTKIKENPLFKPILAYLLIGLLSSLSALFLTRTVPLETAHVGKLMLHWARRVEYMSLAFIFFGAITSLKSLKRILIVFAITGVIVSGYGFGQKYLEWPVYSTMNREFSKGWRLVLTEHARVSSTFAGHYDLAAYSIVLLMTFASFSVVFSPKWAKIPLFMAFLSIFATLLLTASRTSFVAYVGAITLLCMLLVRKKGLKATGMAWVLFMLVSFVGLRSFGSLYERFAHVLRLDRAEAYLSQTVFSRFKSEGLGYIELPDDMSLVVTPTDTPPEFASRRPKKDKDSTSSANLPPDVFEDIPESFAEASLSAVPATTGSGNEGKQRTYSDTAYSVGLSSAIRFDALWPRAYAGFKKNPLLGSGYSTLLKTQVTDFTEAESTDNDYLRALGETGLLGVISFFGIFIYALWQAWKLLNQTKDPAVIAFAAAFIAGMAGLMVNALYIDVFVSSKVAYTVWALMGMLFGTIVVVGKTE